MVLKRARHGAAVTVEHTISVANAGPAGGAGAHPMQQRRWEVGGFDCARVLPRAPAQWILVLELRYSHNKRVGTTTAVALRNT